MKNQNLIIKVFLIILLFFITGCDITPENVDVIANAIQQKYDDINSYKTIVTSISGEYSKKVIREVKRPDKFKDTLIKNEELVSLTTCYNNMQISYEKTKNTATKSINFDCNGKVSDFFNMFDKIKNIFDYNYVIEKTELEGKMVIHLTLTSKDPTHDYWLEQFWFDKVNYQLIKHVYTSMGKEQVTNFDNLELNIDIPDDEFIFEIPSDVKVIEIDAQGGIEVPVTDQPPTTIDQPPPPQMPEEPPTGPLLDEEPTTPIEEEPIEPIDEEPTGPLLDEELTII